MIALLLSSPGSKANFFVWVVYIFQQYWPLFLEGCKTTFFLALTGTILGCVIGLMIGVLRTIPKPKKGNGSNFFTRAAYKILQFILLTYIEIFRGTPMIVQAMVVYYGMSYVGVDLPAMMAGFLVVSINTGAYMAETVRGGIESISIGQTEAAKALGMTHWQTMLSVVLPQTFRNILPQIGNNLIINIKDTSVLNVIAVTELFFNTKSAAGIYYRYFESFFIASILYFIMTFTCAQILRWIERKIDGSGFYKLVDAPVDPMTDPSGTLATKSSPITRKVSLRGMHAWTK